MRVHCSARHDALGHALRVMDETGGLRAARKLIEKGIDPQETRQGAAGNKGSVNQLFNGYLAQMAANGKRSVKETARSLEPDARPLIGGLPAKNITPLDVRDVLYRVVQRGAAESLPRRCLDQALRPLRLSAGKARRIGNLVQPLASHHHVA